MWFEGVSTANILNFKLPTIIIYKLLNKVLILKSGGLFVHVVHSRIRYYKKMRVLTASPTLVDNFKFTVLI